MQFILQKEKAQDIDVLIVKQGLDKQSFVHSYIEISLKNLEDYLGQGTSNMRWGLKEAMQCTGILNGCAYIFYNIWEQTVQSYFTLHHVEINEEK